LGKITVRCVDERKYSNQSLFLIHWSFVHALLMLTATAIWIVFHSLGILLLLAAASFSLLIFIPCNQWTASGTFGWANRVTALRLAGIFTLPFLYSIAGSLFLTAFGFLLLAADGLDGWLARRTQQDSEFGEYFDKETDAFFLLLLCILAVAHGRLGPWVLAAGLLRYIFVIAVRTFRPLVLKEQKTNRARIIYILTMGALLAVFLPYLPYCTLLAAALSLVLVLSFGMDFWGIFRARKPG
jgi:phosphatidylglycerophosphate synthase